MAAAAASSSSPPPPPQNPNPDSTHTPSQPPPHPPLPPSSTHPATNTAPISSDLPPEALDLATRLFTAARTGDLPLLEAVFAHSARTTSTSTSPTTLNSTSPTTPTLPGSAGPSPATRRLANLTNPTGNTLLMLSSYHGHTPIVRLLLRHGADANALNDRGQSPLAGTVFKGERECMDVLLEEGDADPELGGPSAVECVGIFGLGMEEGGVGARLAAQVERLRGRRGRGRERERERGEQGGESESESESESGGVVSGGGDGRGVNGVVNGEGVH